MLWGIMQSTHTHEHTYRHLQFFSLLKFQILMAMSRYVVLPKLRSALMSIYHVTIRPHVNHVLNHELKYRPPLAVPVPFQPWDNGPQWPQHGKAGAVPNKRLFTPHVGKLYPPLNKGVEELVILIKSALRYRG